MQNRNPIARNAWKFNRASAVPNKKSKIQRRAGRYFEYDYDDYGNDE